jgi:hypothetical protein
MELNATILKNKGIPVKIARLVVEGDTARRVEDDETGEPEVRTTWIRFTANEVAEIEEKYGSVDAYQTVMADKPVGTLRFTLSAVWHMPLEHVGLAMLSEQFQEYLLSSQIAWSVAMGLDPTQATKTLEAGRLAMKDDVEKMDAELEKELAALIPASTSPGTNGTGPGSDPVEILSSSGV